MSKGVVLAFALWDFDTDRIMQLIDYLWGDLIWECIINLAGTPLTEVRGTHQEKHSTF